MFVVYGPADDLPHGSLVREPVTHLKLHRQHAALG
jgi:hypothetical protein